MQALEKSETKVELEDLGVSPQNLEGVSSGVGNTDRTRNLERSTKLLGLEDVSNGDKELGNLARTCRTSRVSLTGREP